MTTWWGIFRVEVASALLFHGKTLHEYFRGRLPPRKNTPGDTTTGSTAENTTEKIPPREIPLRKTPLRELSLRKLYTEETTTTEKRLLNTKGKNSFKDKTAIT